MVFIADQHQYRVVLIAYWSQYPVVLIAELYFQLVRSLSMILVIRSNL